MLGFEWGWGTLRVSNRGEGSFVCLSLFLGAGSKEGVH